MKISSSTKSRKVRTVIVVTLLTVIGVILCGLLFFQLQHQNQPSDIDTITDGVNYQEATEEQKSAGNTIKEQSIQNSQESDAHHGQSDLQTQITTLGVEDNTLYIRNEINGIYEQGSCSLKLTNGAQIITRTSEIQALPQSSTCKGFNISLNELPKGSWDITLDITINDLSTTATEEIEL